MPSKVFMQTLYRSLWLMVIWALFSTGIEYRYDLKLTSMDTWQYWVGTFMMLMAFSVVHTWVTSTLKEKAKA